MIPSHRSNWVARPRVCNLATYSGLGLKNIIFIIQSHCAN